LAGATGGAIRAPRGALDWSRASKVSLVAAAVLTLAVWMLWVLTSLETQAEAAFVDRVWLEVTRFSVERVLLPLWSALLLAGLVLRRLHPDGRLLVRLLVPAYVGTSIWASWVCGTHTSPVAASALLGFAVVGGALFPDEPLGAYLVFFLAALVGITVVEQLGGLPYAPLLHELPVRDGRLAGAWLLGLGGFLVLQWAAVLGIASLVVVRWRRDNQEAARTTEQLARSNELISRYVAHQVAMEILAGKGNPGPGHERRRLTLFFSDIEDFTEIAERMEPEDLSEILNEYLSEMVGIAEKHGATIDKFIGDAILAFFGAPGALADREQALRAVAMAAEMQRALGSLRARWQARGIEEAFHVRMGINTGRASVGTFGSSTRMDYTAIGRHVNLAIRLQDDCPPDEILLGPTTEILVRGEIRTLPAREVSVEGFDKPIQTYRVEPRDVLVTG